MFRKSAALKTKAFEFDTKAISDDGLFTGYGSVFGVVDSYNEVVAAGAFVDSLAEIKAKGRTLPILWQHRTGEPIGNWKIDTLKEDSRGLIGEGELWLEESSYAKTAYRGMKSGAITGLSIGYWVRESTFDEKTRIRTLTKLDLVEISIVTTPANDEARIDAVKARLAQGQYPTLREFEEFLREKGFSRSEAEAIAAGGFKNWPGRESEAPQGDTKAAAIQQMSDLLSGFQLPKL